MANEAANVVVGANGSVFVADLEATAPDDVGTPLGSEWTEMGFISEDGATFTEGKDVTDINAWQSFYPIRRIITGRTVTVAFALREWSTATVEFALGGTVSDNGGEFTYTPPSPEDLSEKQLVLDWQDGEKNYRLWIPRGIVSESVETNLTRTGAADLAVTFAATDPGTEDSIYTLFTDDPAFEPVGS